MTKNQTDHVLFADDVRKRWGVSDMWIARRLRDDPTFPKPFKLTEGLTATRRWLTEDIEVWERAALRNAHDRRKE